MEEINEQVSKLIQTLSEKNFQHLIKEYQRAYYNAKEVRIIDGPYDGGNDLEIYVNADKQVKRNIQITVQKTGLEKKILDDAKKASKNVQDYSYLSNLDFYSTYTISPTKKRELIRDADIEYGINLRIIDSNDLASVSDIYPVIREVTYKSHNVGQEKLPLKMDKKSKTLYDVFSLGKNTGELKKQFVHSVILTNLFDNPSINIDELISLIKKGDIHNEGDEKYLRDQINYLKSQGYIISEETKKLKLSEAKTDEINNLASLNEVHENELKRNLLDVLTNYNLQDHLQEIFNLLYKAYLENYEIDIAELAHSSTGMNMSVKSLYNSLLKYIDRNSGTQHIDTKKVVRELLTVCSESDILNKISASVLFMNLYRSQQLENYLNSRKKRLVIDTQILLRLLCLQYENIDIDDNAFKAVKQMYDACKKFNSQIEFITTYDYIEEVARHMQEALKLQRLFDIPIVKKMGESTKNVFYNFYLQYKKSTKQASDYSIRDFLEDLLNTDLPASSDPGFINHVVEELIDIYEDLGFMLIEHDNYDHFQDYKRIYELILAHSDRFRSYSAIENDLRTILYLMTCEEDNDVSNEPFLITWDSLFYQARKEILSASKNKNFYWYIYSPSKFADTISLMNFSINPKALNNNIILLAESGFNYSAKSIVFTDLMSTLFMKEDLSDIKLVHRLYELEKDSRTVDAAADLDDIREEKSPVIEILVQVRNHYSGSKSKHNFSSFIQAFQNNEMEKVIEKLIIESIPKVKNENILQADFFLSFDNIIEESKAIS